MQHVIEADGTFAGTIGSFKIDDRTEVTYWIDRALWGRGIAVRRAPEPPLHNH